GARVLRGCLGGCALPAVEAGGMPSRNMRILLPVPAAGHPWPALGIPPASTAGPDLLRGGGRRQLRRRRRNRAVVTGSSGTATPRRPLRARARPLLISVPKPRN